MNESDKIDKILIDFLDYKNKNKDVINKLNEKFKEADRLVFDETCHKRHYLERCEPEYCIFRIEGKCKYPDAYTRLKSILDH